MWDFQTEEQAEGHVLRLTVRLGAKPATFADVLRAWQGDAAFRALFNAHLAEAAFSAFRWETPPITTSTATQRPFECVLLDSPGLARPHPDPTPFAEHFGGAPETEVLVFPNLGGDATLIVPCPLLAARSAYGHLAAFVRNAPEPQRHALWQAVGAAMAGRVSTKPVWLSTAGGGVPWLHVRLDDRPKYYGFEPYKTTA